MPKAKLVFDLPEEDEEFRQHLDGARYAMTLQEIDNHCRAVIKWRENPSPDSVALAEEIRRMVGDVLWP